LAEWLYEEGIGENRAVLIVDGGIVEALIELPSRLRAGAVVPARVVAIPIPGRPGIAVAEDGTEILVEPVPADVTEGARVRLEVVREPVAEQGRPKRAKGKITDADERPGVALRERLESVVMAPATGPDLFEQAGWSELLEEAATGEIAFPGGALRVSLTPAMTLFDVDGTLPPAALAEAGAGAAGRTIRRLGITGSIGIDLPTLPSKEDRQKAAAALDAALPQPFERTAVNGFGFLQVVRRRERPSIAEILQSDPVGAAARALMRLAERSGGSGLRTIHAAPEVIRLVEPWTQTLSRKTGTEIALRAEPGLAISAGHVHSQFP
jgi:hypothetical protein